MLALDSSRLTRNSMTGGALLDSVPLSDTLLLQQGALFDPSDLHDKWFCLGCRGRRWRSSLSLPVKRRRLQHERWTTSKVTASHLERDAYLYVRQSALRQVLENTESTERQYAFVTGSGVGLADRKSHRNRHRSGPFARIGC